MERTYGDKDGNCILYDGEKCTACGECDRCDLDPSKICDNCGACLDSYNTNEKGFVEIPIDKIDLSGAQPTLDDFYKSMGLEDEDDDEN